MEEDAQNVSTKHQQLLQIRSKRDKLLEEEAEKQKRPQEHAENAVRLQIRSELDKMLNFDDQNMTELEAQNESGTDEFEDACLCSEVDDQMELLKQELSNYQHVIEAAKREGKELETRLIQARNENQNPLFNTTAPLNDKAWKTYMDELNNQVIRYDPTGFMLSEPKDCDLETSLQKEKEKYANRFFSETYPHLRHHSTSRRTSCCHTVKDQNIESVYPENVYSESIYSYHMEELKQFYEHQEKIENELRQKIERMTQEFKDKISQQVEQQVERDRETLKMKQNIAEIETNILIVESNIQNYCVDLQMRYQILEYHNNVRTDMCGELHEVKANIKADENEIRELCEALETCNDHQCQIQGNLDCLKKLIGRGQDILGILNNTMKPLDAEIQALLFRMATLKRMKCKLDMKCRTMDKQKNRTIAQHPHSIDMQSYNNIKHSFIDVQQIQSRKLVGIDLDDIIEEVTVDVKSKLIMSKEIYNA